MIDVKLLMEAGMRMVDREVDGQRSFGLEPIKVLSVWRLDPPDRRITSRTKPDVKLTDETWPELLRGLADWIEQNDDQDLSALVKHWREVKP